MRSNSTTRRPSVQHVCLQCGKLFKVTPSIAKRGCGKFCNRSCQVSYYATQAAQIRLTKPTSPDIPYGYCFCGCNQKTEIADRNRISSGDIKGQPKRYVRGHNVTRYGKVSKPYKRRPVVERFMEKLPDRDEGCWIWKGRLTAAGYGLFWNGDKLVYAHRFSYELFVGPIPESLVIDHLCRVTNCVNPAHLEPVSNQVNVLRGIIGQRTTATHCKHGHLYDGMRNSSGTRICRQCKNEGNIRSYHKRKLEQTSIR